MFPDLLSPCSVFGSRAGGHREEICFTDVESTREREELEGLLSDTSFVSELTGNKSEYAMVDSEWLLQRLEHPDVEAFATPPVELEAVVPGDIEPGQTFLVPGPHGHVAVAAPPDHEPGRASQVTFRLAPQPELRIVVPPQHRLGSSVTYTREDGVQIHVPIPLGMRPGEVFEVWPPVLMVLVPQRAKSGDWLAFKAVGQRFTSCEGSTEYCRARVPDNIGPGTYFAARLPMPRERPKMQGHGLNLAALLAECARVA